MVSRMVGAFALPVASTGLSLIAGTFGGGSGGLTPRKVCRNHLPRATGEVRAAFDVTVSSAPLPSRPRRMSRSAGSVHAAELRAIDVGDAVLLGQPLIDEGVIRGQQIEDAAVLMDDAAEEQLDFALGRRRAGCRRNPETDSRPARWLAASARPATAR